MYLLYPMSGLESDLLTGLPFFAIVLIERTCQLQFGWAFVGLFTAQLKSFPLVAIVIIIWVFRTIELSSTFVGLVGRLVSSTIVARRLCLRWT